MGSLSNDGDRSHLVAALEEAHGKYLQAHQLSRKSHEEACKYMPGGNTRTVLHTSPFPLTIASGDGCMLKTVDGHEYVDFLGEYTAGIYGHNHPVIRQAIEQALDNGWNYGGHNRMEQQLAKIVCERFPAIEKVRFVNSGTEANMLAVAAAIAYTGKKKILVFNKGYHGSTISGRVSTSNPTINLPHEFVVGHYNAIETTRELVKSLPANTLAAILVEPMLGSGGCFEGRPEFLTLLRQLATEESALLIFDEVMTSRLSYNGLAHKIGMKPDLMTLGKWVGGGMSFGAFGGRDDIMSMFDPRTGKLDHAGTFNNNVFSMSAGIAGCALLSETAINNLNQLGDEFRMAINAIIESEKFNLSGETPIAPPSDKMHHSSHSHRPPKIFIKGLGSLMVIHFAGPDRELLQGLFYHHMLQSGIYMAQRGFMALSIMISDVHTEKFLEALEVFCHAWKKYLGW